MEQKTQKKRLELFLNEPGFIKHHLSKISQPISRSQSLKSIYPTPAQLQRFKHLQSARQSGKRDVVLDKEVLHLIGKFEKQVTQNAAHNEQLQTKKKNCLKKLKMDYVEQQMSQNLDQLQKLIGQFEHFNSSISTQKSFVEKMIMTTSIKKALMIQNNILRKENQMLKKQEEEVDIIIKNKKK